MRTTIRKALRWPIGASRTADHALFREGESLPGCRTAMVDQAVDITRQVATASSTGRRTPTLGLAADTTRHVETGSSTSLRTVMGSLATDSSTGRRTATIGLAADTDRKSVV